MKPPSYSEMKGRGLTNRQISVILCRRAADRGRVRTRGTVGDVDYPCVHCGQKVRRPINNIHYLRDAHMVCHDGYIYSLVGKLEQLASESWI